jgi:2-amino-4-hydroxy-6-hydroxymethyldihydropteridine diphosphokinase
MVFYCKEKSPCGVDNYKGLWCNTQIMERAVTAYIGLGSNLGDRKKNLDDAARLLSGIPGIKAVKVSSYYETEPVGYEEQGLFLNAAARVETSLSAQELLHVCQDIETRLGRVRTVRWGPRTVDLDILLFGSSIIDTPELEIPHPLMHERAFVLKPLCELDPGVIHPVLKKTAKELLASL